MDDETETNGDRDTETEGEIVCEFEGIGVLDDKGVIETLALNEADTEVDGLA